MCCRRRGLHILLKDSLGRLDILLESYPGVASRGPWSVRKMGLKLRKKALKPYGCIFNICQQEKFYCQHLRGAGSVESHVCCLVE